MANSDYLITANNVYIKLDEYTYEFDVEANLIEEAKCILINNNKLEDFNTPYGSAYVIEEGNCYIVEHNGSVYEITVEDNMIVDYSKQ